MKPIRIILAGVAILFMATTGWAYDAQLAASYAQLFAPVKGAKAGKELHLMPVEAFVDGVKSGKEYTTLDVRTPAELAIFGAALPSSLALPVEHLFEPENLERIPTNQPVVVVCQSGTRAAAVGTALRHVGFDNVYILKGGFKALAGYLDAKAANTPQEKVAAR
jgi:rhodanese-related sulfurtransferase